MPIQVPLLNGGNIPLRQTGISVPRTAQLEAGNPAIGRAVSQIGADLGQLAEREQRANDARQMLEFETEMRAAEERQQVFQQETQDQDAWLPNWQTQEQELQKSLEGMKLSPDARLTLQSTLGRYVDNKRMAIRDQAVSQSEQRFKVGLNTRLSQAKTPEEVDTIVSLVPDSLMLPEEKEGVRVRAVESVKDNQWNAYTLERARLADPQTRTPESISQLEVILESSKGAMEPERYQLERSNLEDMKDEVFVYSEIQKNPERVIEMMDNPDFAPRLNAPQQREKIKNQAIARIEELRMEEQRNVMNGILTGSVQNMKQAETLMPRADAVIKSKIQGVFEKKPPTQYEASILKRSLEKAVDEYDPTNDPEDAKMFNIIDTINRLNLYDEKITSTLRERFYKKQQGREAPSPLESEIANHKKFLDYVYEPKLKALMDDKGNVPTDKQAEFRSLLSERDQNASEYERLIKSGEIKDRAQARDRSVRSLSEPYANQVMDYWRYRPLEISTEEAAAIEKQRLSK